MKRYFLFTILFITLMSCDDYLDIEPKGKVIPSTIEDYNLLLASIVTLPAEDELFLSTDNYVVPTEELGDINNPDNNVLHLYTFENRFANPDITCMLWNALYQNIYITNKVIDEIDSASGEVGYTEKDKKNIKAEAQYFRASQYLFLVNIFAKHYSKNASSDLAIPLILKADVSQKLQGRSSVAEVYKLIEADLKAAIPNLPKIRKEINRPNTGAGYALLSRMYLYQSKYELALKNAELALKEDNSLQDYTAIFASTIESAYNKEQYTQFSFGYYKGFTKGHFSKDLIDVFENNTNDTRFSKINSYPWKYDYSTGQWIQDKSKIATAYVIQPNPLPSIPEMYVTAAECYARLGKYSQALEKLNLLRRNRISEVQDKTMNDFASTDEILDFALNERRRELLMGGTRLFDLKRLNLETKYQKEIVHKVEIIENDVVKESKEYRAAPNSGKLVLPIPANVKKLNQNL